MPPVLFPAMAAALLVTNATPAKRSPAPALPSPRFALYLVANQPRRLRSRLEPLGRYRLAKRPLISETDLAAYHWRTHLLVLHPAALRRITRQGRPLLNSIFVVTVGRKKIYAGVFWSDFYSSSRSDPVAMQRKNGFRIERAYPTPAFAAGPDPRGHAAIKAALKRAKLLRP
ncbi:MAG: hypothetical protein ABI333_18190 [bacterium]